MKPKPILLQRADEYKAKAEALRRKEAEKKKGKK
jgi:hypothetical protein